MKRIEIITTTKSHISFDGKDLDSVLKEIAEYAHIGLESGDKERLEGCMCHILDLLGD